MELKEKIAGLITEPLAAEGFELIEIKLARFRKSSRLQIFVDSDGGVKLIDCARLSRLIESIVDGENLLEFGYVLEVSSSGLDRPLITARDFRRRIGEIIRVTFNDTEITLAEGQLAAADDESIELIMADGPRKIDLKTVKMGKIIF
jgi:ribosome maturation factor RimP